jgi:Flp pilus assembly protein TadD
MRDWRSVGAIWFALFLSGCTATVPTGPTDAATRDWLLSGAAVLGAPAQVTPVEPNDVLVLDQSMREFAERAASGAGTARNKVTSLIKAVIDPAGLNLRYEPTASYTARETFVSGRANCLSFTLMMVAMLRHVGVDARFNDVDVPLIWDIRDDTTLIFYKHINSIVEFPMEGGRAVVDLNMDEYDTSFEQRTISDHAAIAQYYNNRAMELLQQGDLQSSFPHLVRAITIDPHASYLWNNLGSLYHRARDMQAAKAALEIALTERGSGEVAMSNAARVYAALGETHKAAALTRRVAAFRQANPYFRYVQALSAFRHSDYETARHEVGEAIRLYGIEHRFHFLLGAIYERLGLHQQARESMNAALALTHDEKQLARYRDKMDRLLSVQM